MLIPEIKLRLRWQASLPADDLVLETGSLTGLGSKLQGLWLPPRTRASVSSAASHPDPRITHRHPRLTVSTFSAELYPCHSGYA